MSDDVFRRFLRTTARQAHALTRQCDRLSVMVADGPAPDRLAVTVRCRFLVSDGRAVGQAEGGVSIGIRFPPEYLHRWVPAGKVVTLLGPPALWHPNVLWPAVCLGALPVGADIRWLVEAVYELVTWRRFALDNVLNPAASQWARGQPRARFPIDGRPLMAGRTGGCSDA